MPTNGASGSSLVSAAGQLTFNIGLKNFVPQYPGTGLPFVLK
jgi:hypothetical protein